MRMRIPCLSTAQMEITTTTTTAEITSTTTAAQLQMRVQRNLKMNRLVAADADETERVVAREKIRERLAATVAATRRF